MDIQVTRGRGWRGSNFPIQNEWIDRIPARTTRLRGGWYRMVRGERELVPACSGLSGAGWLGVVSLNI